MALEIPVFELPDGGYSHCKDPHITITVYKSYCDGVAICQQVVVNAFNWVHGQLRGLKAFSSPRTYEDSTPDRLLNLGREHLEKARRLVNEMAEIYETAYARTRQTSQFPLVFTTEEEYLAACAQMGVEPLPPQALPSAVHGSFGFPEYSATECIRWELGRRRQMGINAKKAAADEARFSILLAEQETQERRAASVQLWQPCELCGSEPVNLNFLCSNCST